MEFEEKQNLKLWWLYIILIVDAVIVLSVVLFDKGGIIFKDLKATYFAPLWAVLLPFLIIFLVQKNVLTTKFTPEGNSYRYFPFQIKPRLITRSDIERVYIDNMMQWVIMAAGVYVTGFGLNLTTKLIF